MFRFREFTIEQDLCAMKVGTDAVLLGAWASGGAGGTASLVGGVAGCPQVLDVGTGTGVIALMMAQRFPQAHVVALDIDEPAVRQARQNVGASPFVARVTVEQVAVQDYGQQVEHQGRFDAIVSNPPFFSDSLPAPDRQRQVARHAATLTYAELMRSAWQLLKDDGELSVVVPFDYRQRMEDEATFVGFFPHRVCAVRTVVNRAARRYLLSFVKHPAERDFQVMTLGDDAYKLLTAPFYL